MAGAGGDWPGWFTSTLRAGVVEAGLTTTVAALARLAPWASYFPDFLTPTPVDGARGDVGAGDAGIEAAADRVASTPRRRLTREPGMTFPGGAPPWVRRIAAGEAKAMRWLAGALRRYHEVADAPYAPEARAALTADREARDAAVRRGGAEVAHLIGPTRARVLEALDSSRTTTELARALGLTPATASRHATVLREADLVSSERHGNRVLHSRTRLGDALLAGHVG